MIEKEAVLSFLADQVVAKERVVEAAEAALNAMSEQCRGGQDWVDELLKLTASKAMKAMLEKVAQHVLDLEEV